MSAIFNPSPAQVEVPERMAPEPASGPPSKRSHWRWWAGLALIAILAVGTYALARGKTQRPATRSDIRTAKVAVGPFERILRLSGTTAARNFASITAPMMRG